MNKKILYGGIGAIILLVVVAGGFMGGFEFTLGEGCGYNILSLGSADFYSNLPTLNYEGGILLTVTQSAENECAIGDWDASVVNTHLDDDGKVTDYDFYIKLDSEEQKCIYNINSNPGGSPQYVYYMDTDGETFTCAGQDGDTCVDNKKNKCYNDGGDYFDYVPMSYGWNYGFCFYYTSQARTGDLSQPLMSFPIDVTLKSGTKTIGPITIDGARQGSSEMNDPRVYVEANGYLSGEYNCPQTPSADYKAIYISGQGWDTVEKPDWDSYNTYHESQFKNDFNAITFLDENQIAEDVEDIIYKHNINKADRVLNRLRVIEWDWTGDYTQTSTGGDSNGVITLSNSGRFAYPMLTFHVNADWMGIYTPVGEPRLVDSSVPTKVSFKNGDFSSFQVSVENIGTATGSFEISVDCSPSWITADVSGDNTINVDAGDVGTAEISITGGCASGKKTGSCTVTATERQNSDTSSAIAVVCDPQDICTDGEFQCSRDKAEVQVCKDGLRWETWENCEELYGTKCIVKAGEYLCQESGECEIDEDCREIPDDPCTVDTCVPNWLGNRVCQHTEIPDCGSCQINSDCDDDNECTKDYCRYDVFRGKHYCDYEDIPGCGDEPDWTLILIVLGIIVVVVVVVIVAWKKM